MRIIKILVVGAIGFALGWGIWKATESGYGQPWEKLSAPPKHVTELIPTGDHPFYIKTSAGSTYRYEDWHNEGWLQDAVPPEIMNPIEVKEPCNFRSVEFFPSSGAPKNITDCFQETTMYADGYIKYAVVLDGDGNIWEWQHTVSPDILPLTCLPFLCSLIGLVLAFVSTIPTVTNVKT